MASNIENSADIALEILDNSPSVALRVLGTNEKWRAIFITDNISTFGYTKEEFLSGEICWADVVHPDDIGLLIDSVEKNRELGHDKYDTYYRILGKDGKYTWVWENSTATRDEEGNLLYTDCIISDHTQIVKSKAVEKDVLAQQQVLNDILQSLQSAKLDDIFHIILERTGKYLRISRVLFFEDDIMNSNGHPLYEWHEDGVSPMKMSENYSLDYKLEAPEINEELKKNGLCIINYGEVPPGCQKLFDKFGIVAAAVFSVYHSGRRRGSICFTENAKKRVWEPDKLFFLQNIAKLFSSSITRRSYEESIQRMSYEDQLTGLDNRFRFDTCMKEAITEAISAGKEGYVLFIDMDDFKVINEGYGHDYGDRLLVKVADYLKQSFSHYGRVFRFGGDEFLILVDWQHSDKLTEIVDGVIERARKPWQVGEREFYCTISVGVVCFPEGNNNVTDVIRNADIAMYHAKNSGKNSYVVYSDNMENSTMERAEIEHKMREAIEDSFSGFKVHYQPLVNRDGSIVGAEALVRWVDKEGNLLPPGKFVPLAEYLGLIVPLGQFVMQEAAQLCKKINTHMPDFFMSINVSIRQFQQDDFINSTLKILESTGVNMKNVVLEITEGMVARSIQKIKSSIDALRRTGIRIAMDDFGTGYSSLSNMRELPLDTIKIDRSFIVDVTSDAYSKSFIRLIADLSHSMGRYVCVEGVETAAQHRYCAECGVDYIQGYYFHRPMSSYSLEDLVSHSPPA